MVQQQQTFIHQGRGFLIEADGWPDEEAAAAAIIDLQIWVLQMEAKGTAALHAALEEEREALVHEASYDRDAPPLRAVRDAQRRAVKTGLQGKSPGQLQPTVTLEAYQISST